MLAVRAAILALSFGLLSSPAKFHTAPSATSTSDSVRAVFRNDSSFACQIAVGLPRSSEMARFSPWKARPKIVLAEANQQFSEEADLGPVILPQGLGSPSSVAPNMPTLRPVSPLRC